MLGRSGHHIGSIVLANTGRLSRARQLDRALDYAARSSRPRSIGSLAPKRHRLLSYHGPCCARPHTSVAIDGKFESPVPRISSRKPPSRNAPGGVNLDKPRRVLLDGKPQQADEKFESRSTAELYQELSDAGPNLDYHRTLNIVDVLVRDRGEKPSNQLYTALILANVSHEYGSAETVQQLLEQIEQDNVSPDSATFHAIIKVLSIHPDHLLRSHVLDQMRRHWISLTQDGYHDLIVGLIRDRQVEAALNYIDYMHRGQMTIDPWLYDLLVLVLAQIGEVPGAMKLLQSRLHRSVYRVPEVVWSILLDSASRALLHEPTRYIFDLRVSPGYLIPPSGILNNVLSTAVRHGDLDLAERVIRKIGDRTGKETSLMHYECLIETHLARNDIESAMTYVTKATVAGLPLGIASTRAIFLHLLDSPESLRQAVQILNKLRDNAYAVPLILVNVVIEALAASKGLDEAMSLYHMLDLFIAPKTSKEVKGTKYLRPDTMTFNYLIRGCTIVKNKETAMSLVSDMLELGVKPDAITYDRLALVCLNCDETLDDAWRYHREMIDAGKQFRRGTAVALCIRACCLEDNRYECLSTQNGGLLSPALLGRLKTKYWGQEYPSPNHSAGIENHARKII